ncbi:MAG: glycosyltransferase [Gammaproteobacteria bacterium]|nr:glycosyltransferase [Gammaproteobacteria bacterium]
MLTPWRSKLRTISLIGPLLGAAVVVILIRLLRPVLRTRHRRTSSLWSGAPIHTLAVKAYSERRLGVEARTLVYTTYFLSDRFDYNLQRWRDRPIIGSLLPFVVFVWACWRFDRLHFFCDQGLLPQFRTRQFNPWELVFYRFLGKQVFFWTYGADVRTTQRTKALGQYNCCMACPNPGWHCVCDEQAGQSNHKTIARYATAVFSMGDMTTYTPGSINDVYFWPVDLEADAGRRYAPCYPSEKDDRPVRVVHAPNHRYFKGTQVIIDAVEQLRAEGAPIELVLVEGLPNEQALGIYRTADIVFDQCLIGFHGYFAHEAMALGKPVMCFIRRPNDYLLAPDECPIINTPAPQVPAVLRRLVADRRRLRQLGIQGRRYIETYHTPQAFSERLARKYATLGVSAS